MEPHIHSVKWTCILLNWQWALQGALRLRVSMGVGQGCPQAPFNGAVGDYSASLRRFLGVTSQVIQASTVLRA